jgi:hypothetical protein
MLERSYTDAELNALLERAAARGATVALAKLGLDDTHARADVDELRSLLSAWRDTKTEVWKTVVKWGTMTFLVLIGFVVSAKLGIPALGGGKLP